LQSFHNMPLEIRSFQGSDVENAARLIHSFWGLNVEFEPSMEIGENELEQIKGDLKQASARDDQMIFVACSELGLVGIIRIEMKQAKFRGPVRWGNIVEFYVLPRERRKAVAKHLLDHASGELKKKGIKKLTAEFPTQNVPAASFYERNGFRPFQTIFARDVE
jgi:ribosomal protein S18 acetylase RimI-like enzyme